ncbi:MAG: hypothetical protein HC802_02770 [Caldilineaceae bacterium]|nr:hypothetical protein [Caldilineaceae bacterium]
MNQALANVQSLTPIEPAADAGAATWVGAAVQPIRQFFWLPNSLTAFAIYCLALTLICVGMLLHILMSSQLMESELKLAKIKAAAAEIEQRNADLIAQISETHRLDKIRDGAVALGYQTGPSPAYVVAAAPDDMADEASGGAPNQADIGLSNAPTEAPSTPAVEAAGGKIAALLAYLRRQPTEGPSPSISGAETDSRAPATEDNDWFNWWRETRTQNRQNWAGIAQAWRFELPKLRNFQPGQ